MRRLVDRVRLRDGGVGRRVVRRHEIVHPLPSVALAEDRPLFGVRRVERRTAQTTCGLELLARPRHGVMHPKNLLDAVSKEHGRAVEATEPADIDAPDVARRCPLRDPLGQRTARSSGVGDTGRVEPGRHEEAAALGRLTENVLVIRCERLGSVDERVDLSLLETRDPVGSAVPNLHKMIVVVREQVELEVGWHPLGPDRLGFWFESAYEQARTPLAKVSERVVVAVDRQARVHAREGVGRHVKVLARVERYVDLGSLSHLTRPLPAT
mmetsp:Transcript_5067/g.11126  ORF Transcript_5067/g.11126 Transcript_5067/m.11126 type:complete len:268 (-) Transcript_5067:694-1497(-)